MTANEVLRRPLLVDAVIKAGMAALLTAASYLALAAFEAGDTFIGWLGILLSLSAFGVALVAGSACANLISLGLSGNPRRPGRVSLSEEADSELWLGPFSRTQVALMSLVVLSIPLMLVLDLLLPSETVGVLWMLFGLACGLWYRV